MFYESSSITFADAKKLRNEPACSEIIFGICLSKTFRIIDLKNNFYIAIYCRLLLS